VGAQAKGKAEAQERITRMMADNIASGSVPQDPASPESASQQSMLFVQALKGAPASVLLALAITGRFMSHKDLQLWTRCGHRQVTAALRTLEFAGWAIARTDRGPWAIAPGISVPVPSALQEGSALRALSSSSDSLNRSREDSQVPSAPRGHVLEALREAGIREPTASELAALPHVTPEYVRAHILGARANGLRIGAAIEAMRLQAPPPAVPVPISPEARQAQTEEQIRRFIEGG
jgi:hypothetical protein